MKIRLGVDMFDNEQYAHVLLFACPQCDRPLAATCVSAKKNLEIAEAKWFTNHCHCGWAGDIAGVTAIRHWVLPWRGKAIVAGDPADCSGVEVRSAK
jgi:hypothetical protein